MERIDIEGVQETVHFTDRIKPLTTAPLRSHRCEIVEYRGTSRGPVVCTSELAWGRQTLRFEHPAGANVHVENMGDRLIVSIDGVPNQVLFWMGGFVR